MNSSTSSSDQLADERRPWRTAARRSAPAIALTVLIVGSAGWLANQRLAHYPATETAAHRKFAQMERPQQYDAIVIGTSIASFGIDPRCFSEGAYYNFALPGAAGRMTRVIVDRFLDAGNSARIVLFEINPLTFDPEAAWRRPYHDADAIGVRWADQLQHQSYGPTSLETLRYHGETIPLWSRRAPLEWFLFGIDGRGMIRSAAVDEERLDKYVLGHVPLEDRPIPPAELARTVRTVTRRKNPVVRADVDAVDAVIARLQAAGSMVILFEAPVCGHQTAGESYMDYKQEVSRLVEKYQLAHLNYREHQLSSETVDQERYFWDRTHLSQSGAGQFSQELWRDVQLSLRGSDSPNRPAPSLVTVPDDRRATR